MAHQRGGIEPEALTALGEQMLAIAALDLLGRSLKQAEATGDVVQRLSL